MIKFQIIGVGTLTTIDILINRDNIEVINLKKKDINNYYGEESLAKAIKEGDFLKTIKIPEDVCINHILVKKIVKQRKGYNWCTSSYQYRYTKDGKKID